MRAPRRARQRARGRPRMRGSKRPRPRWWTGDALLDQQARGRLRRASGRPARRRSARGRSGGNHQEKSRDTPWMLDPATPNLSQTWRTGTAISSPGAGGGAGRLARRPDHGAREREQDDEAGADQAEGERALARQAELREVQDEHALADAPAVERDGHRLHQACRAARSGSRRRAAAGCAASAPRRSSRRRPAPAARRWPRSAVHTAPSCSR